MNESTVSVRQHSARMRRFVTVLWAICLTLVVLERFSAAGIALYTSGFAGSAQRAFACQLVAALPEALFLLGLWGARHALAGFARGDLFTASVTRMLDRIGLLLACGSAVRIFVVPGVCRLMGVDAGHWIAFDSAAMVLGAIGLALRSIAGVLRHASLVQSELDEIF